jgi:alpha-tubulin suppressor-like RCC1 family protein
MPEEWEAAGCGGTTSVCSTPAVISGFSAGVVSVAAGWEDYACALLSTGGVECWGSDAIGQLGEGLSPTSGVPVPVSGLGSGVAEVVAGGAFACARMMDGTVKCWGDNTSQQLGAACPTSPSPSMCSTPVGVVGL